MQNLFSFLGRFQIGTHVQKSHQNKNKNIKHLFLFLF